MMIWPIYGSYPASLSVPFALPPSSFPLSVLHYKLNRHESCIFWNSNSNSTAAVSLPGRFAPVVPTPEAKIISSVSSLEMKGELSPSKETSRVSTTSIISIQHIAAAHTNYRIARNLLELYLFL